MRYQGLSVCIVWVGGRSEREDAGPQKNPGTEVFQSRIRLGLGRGRECQSLAAYRWAWRVVPPASFPPPRCHGIEWYGNQNRCPRSFFPRSTTYRCRHRAGVSSFPISPRAQCCCATPAAILPVATISATDSAPTGRG